MARLIMITKGLLVRAIFSISSITSVWGAVTVKNNTNFWLLLNTSGLLFVEAAFTFSRKRMGEWKWFCPSVFLYLVASLPSIWLIELQLMNDRRERFDLNKECPSSDEIHTNVTRLHAFPDHRITIPLELTSQSWSVALQQQLIFVLILGRWMLPKGKLTRDQLSQLLLVYIGIAADILEFSTEGLKLKEVRCRFDLTICILGIWNWSLLQFAIGLTVTKARKPRVAGLGLPHETKHALNPVAACCETEVWGIMATIIMQDGPFLAMRLYLVIEIEARQHMMIFFTCKNILIILLQLYRLAVIYLERPHPQAHHFMQQTFARYRGHTFRSSGGSQCETETKLVRKKPNNTMKQTTSKQKLLMSPNDPIAEQTEPLMKNTNERQEKRRPRSMQKRSPSESVSRKKVNNDARPLGPKQTSIPPAGKVRAPPKEDDVTNPRAKAPGRRDSNKPKNTDDRMKSNLKKPVPVHRQNSPSSSLPVPRQQRSTDTPPLGPPSGKPIERVNFAFPEDSDNSDTKLARRKQSGKAMKSPETLPLNFLDSSKPRRTAGASLASIDDEW